MTLLSDCSLIGMNLEWPYNESGLLLLKKGLIILRSVKLKKTQLRKIVILLVLSAMGSVYASELSMTPFGVANAVAITITFTNSTSVTEIGFGSAPDMSCGPALTSPYTGGSDFALGAPPTKTAYFNGYLPALAGQLDFCTTTTSGTISLDGVLTDLGLCSAHAGCYSYTCDSIGGSITSITPITPFTATCA